MNFWGCIERWKKFKNTGFHESLKVYLFCVPCIFQTKHLLMSFFWGLLTNLISLSENWRVWLLSFTTSIQSFIDKQTVLSSPSLLVRDFVCHVNPVWSLLQGVRHRFLRKTDYQIEHARLSITFNSWIVTHWFLRKTKTNYQTKQTFHDKYILTYIWSLFSLHLSTKCWETRWETH